MLNSCKTFKNFSAKFSPVWGPDKIQKSKVVHFNSQLLLIQCTLIPRKGIWFLLVHASTVNDNKPDTSYFIIILLNTILININFN